MSDTSLIDLQLDIGGRLTADEGLVDIPVYDERKADIATEIEVALGTLTGKNGKMGACCVVLQPTASDEMPDAPFGPMKVNLSILVLENVLVNKGATGTGKHALTIARRIHRILKHYIPGGIAACLNPSTPTIVPVENPLADVAYEVRFETTEADPGRELKVATPAISPTSGTVPRTVTITCGTSGASIYYTLDGTYPRSGNGTLYSGPVTVTQAAMLRAGAYKTGMIGSDIAYGVYS